MNDAEALALLREQFAGPTGFLARLQRGEGIDRDGVQHVWQALDTQSPIWARNSRIPKDLASWFVQLRDIVMSGWTLYDNWPDSHEAHRLLLRIADDLSEHLTGSLQCRTSDSAGDSTHTA